ncbi:MAG: T9SS type A sorting domain-containing protein, partial [Candidatus Marinimicrobia bacterium]|nr:T9SS type A sorting domain-containing protein [Candidatus Neomarinimicrobiota bacterium]
NYGWGNKFSFEWEDNFDYFDTQRWQKATHTFEGNNCDFIPDNVVFKDGYMILCLTTPENPGYSWIDENDLFCDGFELLNAYPNPFNSHLNIALNVKKESSFQISIYDLCGNLVNEIYNNYLCLGQHILQFNGMDRNGKDIHSGMYILRIDSNYGTVRKKVTFLK